jgi:integrase
VFKLKAKGADGQPLWAYRYRLEGRSSARPQVGGFATRAEAQKGLRKALDRVCPGRGGATTLAELVEEYLQLHQAEPVTIAKLRWLLGKAIATLGQVALSALSPKDVYAWRLTVPEGHRFEATQALRRVLNRAVTWGLIDDNSAKRGVPNPQRRAKEKRPFESWQQIEAIGAQLGAVYGPMVVFAAATGLRPSELFALEHRDIDLSAGVVYVRRAYANGRLKHTKTRLGSRAVPLQAKALEALELEASSGQGGHRAAAPSLRLAAYLHHVRTASRRFSVRGLPLHGFQHRDDRPPLRPPRPRQPRTRRLPAGRARARTGRGRWVDVAAETRKALNIGTSRPRSTRSRRAVDARWTPRLVLVASVDNEKG